MESRDARKSDLYAWLITHFKYSEIELTPIAGDASFRRYFRLRDGSESLIVMDAPPPQENCRPFVAIAKALQEMGLKTPIVFAQDLSQGFLLLSDFGDQTYLSSLNEKNAQEFYKDALDALAIISTCKKVEDYIIPPFTAEFMYKEWEWHKEWFINKWLGLTLSNEEKALNECYALIVESAIKQPQVFMHRDYHSANLMRLPADNNMHRVGILDFQDAFIGPLTYDIASLLRDCYIAWPENNVYEFAAYYRHNIMQQHAIAIDEKTFFRWFDLMCIQRHLKALMTFSRKKVRDHDENYLQHIPRTISYLVNVTDKYPELKILHEFLEKSVAIRVKELL